MALLLLITCSSQVSAQCYTYTIVACIDGQSLLHIEGNQLWWEHLSYSPPGTHSSCPGPVTVNGDPWTPWNTPYTLPNTTAGCSLVANIVQCSYICNVIQAPTAANNWEAIYDFNDNAPGGAHMFTIELQYFCPTVDAGPDQSICPNESANLNASGGISFDWTPASGLSCTNCPDPVASPSTTTTYSVTGTDINGCSATDDITVTVLSSSMASFTIGNVCGGAPVQFTDNSTGNPTSWQWDFGDNTPVSSSQNPTHLYALPGSYTVTLTVTANGCTNTTTAIVEVPPPLETSATGTDPTCYGGNDGTGNITVIGGTAPYSFAWSTGSTQQNATDLVAGGNIYTVTDANSCTHTDSVVLAQPNSLLSSATATYVSAPGVCDATATVNPSGGTPPYTYNWSTGQNTQNVSGLCEGIVNVTVTDANGCVTTQPLNINIPQCLTDVDFYTWVQAGQPANGNWIVQGGGTQVLQTTNGNPTFFVTPADYINVRMRGRFKTTDNDDDFMGVVFGFKEPLGASDYFDTWLFDWKQGTQSSGIFTGQEGFNLSHAMGTIPSSQYSGTFWGHTTTPEFNVVATNYGNNGWNQNTWYNIELVYTVNRAIILVDGDTIFDVDDCFEAGRFGFYNYSQRNVTYADFVYELFADFTVEDPTVCAGDTAHFTFLEQCGNFNNLSQFDELHWDFGDGNTLVNSNLTLANVNPRHIYQSGGNYTVQLVALDTLGCRDTVYKNIHVLQKPIADFMFSDQCFQDNTQFSDASQQGDYPIAGYAWLIDGNQVVQQNTTYQFSAPGQYIVGLAVQDTYGCLDTVTHLVDIFELPQAAFTPIEDCFAPNYPFEDVSTIDSGTVDSWEWDFGDGGTADQQNPTHTYTTFGQYDVTLIAVSDQGCGDTVTQSITLHDNPVPGFEIPNICQLEPMQFLDTATIQEGSIVSWQYDFGDGNNSTDQNPLHMFADAGVVNVTQTITSDFGCATSVTVPTEVDPKPEADFATQNVCLNEVMNFIDQSSVASGMVTDWDWTFGDGNTDTVPNTSNLYSTFGIYTVMQMVESDNGCRDTTEQQVEVYQLPGADFSFADVCLDATATFTDQSSSNSGSVDTWNWDLGDGATSTGQGPIDHDYALPGNYDVELIVETDLGCFDTIVQTITVYPMPEADFIADSVCFNQITTFTDQTDILSGSIINYAWDFGFSGSSSQPDPTFIFPETGYLPVFLTVTSDFGCKDTVTKDIRVYVLPEPEFAHNDTCYEDNVNFVNHSVISEETIDQYDWDFDDTNSSNEQDPVHHYDAPGFYQVELVATSNHGCTVSVLHQVEIYPLPQVSFAPIPTEGCQPLTVTFDNGSTIENGYYISGYEWDFGQGLTSTGSNPQTIYPDSGLYDVQLIITTTNGCDDTLLVADAIDVWPRPIAEFRSDKDHYSMYFPEVDFIDESHGATEWYYDFDDGSSSEEQQPSHEYQQAGTYQVVQTVNNDYGCDDEYSVRVIVEPAITFYIPDAFTPDNDGINDVFFGNGVGVEEYQMWIFDRWGENIFYSAKMDEAWDGTYKGVPVEAGVYVYKFFILDVDGNDHLYTGGVQLLR